MPAAFLAKAGAWLGKNALNMIGIGTGAASDVARFAHEKKRDERQFQHSKDMAEYQYNKDLEMWNRANEYNAPTQQMARLREAGLNPRLVYGQSSSGAAGMAAQSPKYASVRPEYRYSQPFNPMQAMSAYMSLRKHNAEMDLLKAQTKDAESKASYSDYYYDARAEGTYMSMLKKMYEQQAIGPNLAPGTRMPLSRLLNTTKLAFEGGRITKQDRETKKIEQDKRLREAQADWYVSQLLWRLGISSVNSISGLIKGFVPKINIGGTKPKLPGIRYNSPASWKSMGY